LRPTEALRKIDAIALAIGKRLEAIGLRLEE
jgi:hypothetical protein